MADFKIKIRRMQKCDLDQVEKIEAEAYGPHHWSKEAFANELHNSYARYYVALNENDEVIGYMGLWHVIDEAHFSTICVSPDYRRRHVGEALFKRLIDDCYENLIKYITLEVRVSNLKAQHLYKKYGLKNLGTRKGYYQDNNEDAYIMWSENIFYDKFKQIYDKNVRALEQKIEIETGEEEKAY